MRTIIIYDGKTTNAEEMKYKKEFSFSNETFSRDVTSLKKSTVQIYDPENIVETFDLFHVKQYGPFSFTGRVIEIEENKKNKIKTLSLIFGADTFTNSVFVENNSLSNFSFLENNWQSLDLKLASSIAVTATDEVLNVDVFARQMLRNGEKVEEMTRREIKIDDFHGVIPSRIFREDDPELSGFFKNFPDDQYNTLILRNSANKSQKKQYFLTEDGNVTLDSSLRQKPKIEIEEIVENYEDIDYATSKIKQQQYNNEINFSMKLKTEIDALRYDKYLPYLGRKVEIILSSGKKIKSIISAYELKNESYITLKMGLSRSKFTENQNKDEGV